MPAVPLSTPGPIPAMRREPVIVAATKFGNSVLVTRRLPAASVVPLKYTFCDGTVSPQSETLVTANEIRVRASGSQSSSAAAAQKE